MSETTKTLSPEMQAIAHGGIDVCLENFEGPLDLLLYLIKKSDLDIYDIPIAHITQEYLRYLDLMKDLNLETAGEFLVMASTLMQIKAQMLLPTPEAAEEEGPDPRAELMNRLLEYQQYKEAASILTGFNEKAKNTFYRNIPPRFGEDDYVLRASMFDLMNAFKRVLEEAPKEVGQILRDEITIESKIREILDRLVESTSLSFEELFAGARRRSDMIVTFLATLELIRLKQIVARQSVIFGSIRIYRADAVPDEKPSVPIESEPEPIVSVDPGPLAKFLAQRRTEREPEPAFDKGDSIQSDSAVSEPRASAEPSTRELSAATGASAEKTAEPATLGTDANPIATGPVGQAGPDEDKQEEPSHGTD